MHKIFFIGLVLATSIGYAKTVTCEGSDTSYVTIVNFYNNSVADVTLTKDGMKLGGYEKCTFSELTGFTQIDCNIKYSDGKKLFTMDKNGNLVGASIMYSSAKGISVIPNFIEGFSCK